MIDISARKKRRLRDRIDELEFSKFWVKLRKVISEMIFI